VGPSDSMERALREDADLKVVHGCRDLPGE
jgi:hypothetical protein